jgi:hypothetical protein
MGGTKGIPETVSDQLKQFHSSLTVLKSELQHFIDNEKEIREEAAKDAETQANLDLTICYTANSLYWSEYSVRSQTLNMKFGINSLIQSLSILFPSVYLIACGQNPKDDDIRLELQRVRKHMTRLNEIRERKLRPTLNQKASGSFVRNALFDPKNPQNRQKK